MKENIDNVCVSCPRHCCRHPMMLQEDIKVMAIELGLTEEDIPVKRCDMSKLHHLSYLDFAFFEMNNDEHCFAFKPGEGCQIPHKSKPVICRLYPWIPYNFEGDEWELLLDVTACANWEVYGKKHVDVTKEFDAIRAENPSRWKST